MVHSIVYIVLCNLALLNFGTEMVINFWVLPYILPMFLLLKHYLSNTNMLLITAAINMLLAAIINAPILIKDFRSGSLFSINFVYLMIFTFEFIYSGILILHQRKSQNKADRYAFTKSKYFSALIGGFSALFFVLPLYIAFGFALYGLSTALEIVLILSMCFVVFAYIQFSNISCKKIIYALSALLFGILFFSLFVIMFISINPTFEFGDGIAIYLFCVYTLLNMIGCFVFYSFYIITKSINRKYRVL